jgi:UDP-3-O-[3-hydroxymyristoyl] glucosamine N-acyltransferase
MASTDLHPTAIIGENVQLGPGCRVGPYAILGLEVTGETRGQVTLGSGVTVGAHALLYGEVEIGDRSTLDPFSRVGPRAAVGSDNRILYGARVHEECVVGDRCRVAGNCPDRTIFGSDVVHLGRIAHSFHFPFAEDWDLPQEQGPSIGSRVAIGPEALIVGAITIGDNTFVLPGEVVRSDLPGDGIYRGGQWSTMPNWTKYLRLLGRYRGEGTTE